MCAFCGNDHGNGLCPWVPDERDYEPDDDQGPLDSDYGDSEADHVWVDLARSEAE